MPPSLQDSQTPFKTIRFRAMGTPHYADGTQILDLDMTFQDDFPDPTPMRSKPGSMPIPDRAQPQLEQKVVAELDRHTPMVDSLQAAIAKVHDEPLLVGFGEKLTGDQSRGASSFIASTSTCLKRSASQDISAIPKRVKTQDDYYQRRVADSDRRNSLGRSLVQATSRLPAINRDHHRERPSFTSTSQYQTAVNIQDTSVGSRSQSRIDESRRGDAGKTQRARDQSVKTVIEIRPGGFTQIRKESAGHHQTSIRQSSIPTHRSSHASPVFPAQSIVESSSNRPCHPKTLMPSKNPLANLAISPIRPRMVDPDVSAIIDVDVDPVREDDSQVGVPDGSRDAEDSVQLPVSREPSEAPSVRPKTVSPTPITSAEQETGEAASTSMIAGENIEKKQEVVKEKTESRRTSLLGFVAGLLNRSISLDSLSAIANPRKPSSSIIPDARKANTSAQADPETDKHLPQSVIAHPQRQAQGGGATRKALGQTLTRPQAPSFARRPLQSSKPAANDTNVPRNIRPVSELSIKPSFNRPPQAHTTTLVKTTTSTSTSRAIVSKVAPPIIRRPASTSAFASAALARLPPPGKGATSASAPVTIRDAERARDIAVKRAVFERLASTNTESTHNKASLLRPTSASRQSTRHGALAPTVPVTGRTPGKASRARAEARALYDAMVREKENQKEMERREVENIRKEVDAHLEKMDRRETIVWAAPLPSMYGKKL